MSEKELENKIRNIIKHKITSDNPRVYTLKNKKAVDILICKDSPEPELFFLEIKFHKQKHVRLGFGGANGTGFQPEILDKKPKYFEQNLRWVLGSENHSNSFLFLNNETIRNYASGGEISQKFNNIQTRIFNDQNWLSEDELVESLKSWMKI